MVERVWNTLEMLRWTTEYLEGKAIGNARLNAELLLAGTLGWKRLDLYLRFERPLAPAEIAEFKRRLLRRARREPLQYIEGCADFRDLRLRVDRRVLIPRPETELLVGAVLAWARGRAGLEVLDVGTGSGAIALALATEGCFARVAATDASGAALEVARENVSRSEVAKAVELREGAGYVPVEGERFDIVVSNPPYVSLAERDGLDPEVRDWEPAAALFGGHDGLELIRELVAGAPRMLRPGGLLALEIGAAQGATVTELIGRTSGFASVEVRRDLAGHDRIVLAHVHETGR